MVGSWALKPASRRSLPNAGLTHMPASSCQRARPASFDAVAPSGRAAPRRSAALLVGRERCYGGWGELREGWGEVG